MGLNVSDLVNFFPSAFKGQFGRLRRKRPLKANRPADLTCSGAISFNLPSTILLFCNFAIPAIYSIAEDTPQFKEWVSSSKAVCPQEPKVFN